jgi:hypothetical protein
VSSLAGEFVRGRAAHGMGPGESVGASPKAKFRTGTVLPFCSSRLLDSRNHESLATAFSTSIFNQERTHSAFRNEQRRRVVLAAAGPVHIFSRASKEEGEDTTLPPILHLPSEMLASTKIGSGPSATSATTTLLLMLLVGSTLAVVAAAATAVEASGPPKAALVDAVTRSLVGGGGGEDRSRNLLDATACQEEAVAMLTCVRNTLSVEAETECSACMTSAFEAALPTFAASDYGCDDWSTYMCAPVPACPCTNACINEYNAYAECLLVQGMAEAGEAFTCDINCGTSSSSTGGGGSGTSGGSSGGTGSGSDSGGTGSGSGSASSGEGTGGATGSSQSSTSAGATIATKLSAFVAAAMAAGSVAVFA